MQFLGFHTHSKKIYDYGIVFAHKVQVLGYKIFTSFKIFAMDNPAETKILITALCSIFNIIDFYELGFLLWFFPARIRSPKFKNHVIPTHIESLYTMQQFLAF